MEFDKSRVYTAVNADELRAGDKVIVADTMGHLKYIINNPEVQTLKMVCGEETDKRFAVDENCVYECYALAYLVERKENCTNCGNGRWDAEHQKILCDPVNCGNGNVVFRNHEIEVCEYWKPKTEQEVEHDCQSCKYKNCGFKYLNTKNECDEWKTEQKAEKKYRPFKDTDELIKVWLDKGDKWKKRELTMPYIWVVRTDKSTGVSQHLITSLNVPILKNELWINGVSVEGTSITLEALFRCYEFLDGSPCGVEE